MNKGYKANQVATVKRGWRVSLAARFALLLIGVLSVALAFVSVAGYYFPYDGILIAASCLLIFTPISIALVRSQLRPILELFRAMSGTVLSYQDRDFSFGIHW